jgi:hypothetical protein
MLVDIVVPAWVPFGNLNVNVDIPGSIDAVTTALSYPWKTFIGGHMVRLGTREEVLLHQAYMADLDASTRVALTSVDPTPYFVKYGDNQWAAIRTLLDAVTAVAAEPVIRKYLGILAAVDVYTQSNAYTLQESLRIDSGAPLPVHP